MGKEREGEEKKTALMWFSTGIHYVFIFFFQAIFVTTGCERLLFHCLFLLLLFRQVYHFLSLLLCMVEEETFC